MEYETFKKQISEIEVEEIETNSGGFTRWFQFVSADGQIIKLEWYKNVIKVYIGAVEIICDSFTINNFWPNKYSLNLNLFRDGNLSAIIPIK